MVDDLITAVLCRYITSVTWFYCVGIWNSRIVVITKYVLSTSYRIKIIRYMLYFDFSITLLIYCLIVLSTFFANLIGLLWKISLISLYSLLLRILTFMVEILLLCSWKLIAYLSSRRCFRDTVPFYDLN